MKKGQELTGYCDPHNNRIALGTFILKELIIGGLKNNGNNFEYWECERNNKIERILFKI